MCHRAAYIPTYNVRMSDINLLPISDIVRTLNFGFRNLNHFIESVCNIKQRCPTKDQSTGTNRYCGLELSLGIIIFSE